MKQKTCYKKLTVLVSVPKIHADDSEGETDEITSRVISHVTQILSYEWGAFDPDRASCPMLLYSESM